MSLHPAPGPWSPLSSAPDPVGDPIARELEALEREKSDPVRQRLIATLECARMDLRLVRAGGPDGRDPRLILWELGRPGFLRDLGDEDSARPSGVLVLAPVALTWLGLGYAEFSYGRRFDGVPIGERPSFFAYWISRPWWEGPVALSGLIVLSLALIMIVYSRAESQQRSVDDLDRRLLRLEEELIRPIAELRRSVAVGDSDDRMLHAATQLAHASDQFGHAFGRLSDIGPVVSALVAATEGLREAVPDVGRYAAAVAALDDRLRETAREVAEQTQPLVDLVATSAAVTETVRVAAEQAGAVIVEARRQIEEVRDSTMRAEADRGAVDRAAHPFVAAAERTDRAATRLAGAADVLARNARDLEGAIGKVNWLALVADGLQYTDGQGRPDGRRGG